MSGRDWRWSRLVAGLVAVLLAAVVGAGLLMAWLNSDAGRDRIESLADGALEDLGLSLKIEGWSGRLPFGLDAEAVQIDGSEGVALRITDLHVDWRVLPLLLGKVRIDTLEARSVLLERWPARTSGKGPGDMDHAASVPAFLLQARVGHLALAHVELGEAVLGARAVWRVAGEIGTVTDDGHESYLDVSRTDGRSDRFLATLNYRRAEGAYALEALWEEAAGGAFARLLAPGSPEGIAVRLTGDGPLDAWYGQLSARAPGATVDVSFRAETDDESHLTIEGRVDAAALLPSRLSALGAGDLGLTVTFRKQDQYRVVGIPSLHYTTANLTVSAHGSLDRWDGSLAGQIDLSQTDSGNLDNLLAPVAVSGLGATLILTGSLGQPGIESVIRAEHLVVAGVSAAGVDLKVSLSPEIAGSGQASRVGIEASLESREIGWSLTGMEKLIRGPARARMSGEIDGGEKISLASLIIELPDAHASGSVELDLAGRTLKAPIQVVVTDLDALDPLTRLDLEGAAILDVDLALPGFDGRVDIDVSGRTREFSLGLPVVRAIASPAMDVAATLAISPGSGLSISGIRISGSRASVAGSVVFPAGYDRMDISAQGRLPDASVLSPELKIGLAGAADVAAKLSGPIRNPQVDGTLAVEGVDLPAGRWNGVRGTYSLASLADGAHGPVSVSGDGPVGLTRVAAVLTIGDGVTDLRDIRGSANGLAVSGEIRVPHTGAPFTGSFDATVDDFGPMAAGLLGWEVSGKGSARVTFDATEGVPDVRLIMAANRIRAIGGPNRPLSADRLDIQGHLRGVGGELEAELTVENFSGPSSWFPVLKATAKGAPADVHLGIDTQGRVLGAPAVILAELDIRTGASLSRITLTRLDGSLDGLPVQSNAPVTLTMTDGRLELRDVDLRLGQGEIKGSTRLGVPDSEVDATIVSLPLELFRLIDPALSLSGVLDARLELRAQQGGTVGAVEVVFRDVLPPHRRRMIPLNGSVHGRLSSGKVAFEASAAAAPESPVTITGELPLDIDLAAVRAGMQPEGQIRGRLDWSGDAFDILSLLPLEDHLVNGPMSVTLNLSGTVADPRVAGQVALHDGRYEHLLAGTVLSPLEILIEGDGESLRLMRLEAGDGGAGTLTGSGSLLLDPESGFPLQASLGFMNLTLLRRDEITGRATGELRASGPLGNLQVTGQVRTNDVEVGLANNLPPQVVELELIEADASGVDGTIANGAGRQQTRLIDGRFDVNVAMPSRVFLRGLGLDSEWQGDLQVRGPLGQPEILGRLQSVRGVLMFFGRRFRLEPSSLVFTGGRKIDPELDVRSTHEGQELTVNLALTGPISNPDLSLSSVPPVPEDEILARALFGKSAGQLTAVEAVQLAAAVSELTTRSSGPGVLARLREAVGVDVLRFGSVETAEGEQATTFEAGRYVTEGLYVGVETSTVEEGGAVSVEYEVSRRLRLTTDIKQTGGQNIGVEYKRDY